MYQEQILRLQPKGVPEVNITVPGLDKTIQELANLSKSIAQSPHNLRLEMSQLVSFTEERLNAIQTAYQSGFVSGVVLTLIVAAVCFFLSRARNQNAT